MAHALERKLCWKKSGGRSERSGPRSGHLAARQVMVFWARTLGRRFENPGLFFFSVRRRAGEPVRPGAGGTGPRRLANRGATAFPFPSGLARLRARASDVRERRAQPTARSSFRANDDHRRTRAGRPAGILPRARGRGRALVGDAARPCRRRRDRECAAGRRGARHQARGGRGERVASPRRRRRRAAGDARERRPRAALGASSTPRVARPVPPPAHARLCPPLVKARSPKIPHRIPPPRVHASRTTSARTTPRRRKRPRA